MRHDALPESTAANIGAAPLEVQIRPFEAGDAEAFRRLNEEWILQYFRLEEPDGVVLGNPEREILQPGGQILMAVDDGLPVGCCALLAEGDGVFELAKMAVTEGYRGRGLGRRLLERAVASARAMGATRLRLSTNHTLKDAIHLYESIGFERQTAEPSLYARADVFMDLSL